MIKNYPKIMSWFQNPKTDFNSFQHLAEKMSKHCVKKQIKNYQNLSKKNTTFNYQLLCWGNEQKGVKKLECKFKICLKSIDFTWTNMLREGVTRSSTIE